MPKITVSMDSRALAGGANGSVLAPSGEEGRSDGGSLAFREMFYIWNFSTSRVNIFFCAGRMSEENCI